MTFSSEGKGAGGDVVLGGQAGTGQVLPAEQKRLRGVHAQNVMAYPEPFLTRKHLSADTEPLEVVENVRLDSFQPRLCRAHTVRVNAKGQILGFDNAVVALFLLILYDPGQLPLDALKLVCAHRDRPQGSTPQAGQIDKGQLEGNGAVEVVEEIAPAVKDGLLVLVVRELVVDVPELDGFCVVIPCHLTNAILPHEQIRKAAGFEQAEAEQHGIAHAGPDGGTDVAGHGNILHQHRVNCHAYHNEKRLEAQGKKGTQIVLPHLSPFPVDHGCHWNGCYGGDEEHFNHSSIGNNKNADGDGPGA